MGWRDFIFTTVKRSCQRQCEEIRVGCCLLTCFFLRLREIHTYVVCICMTKITRLARSCWSRRKAAPGNGNLKWWNFCFGKHGVSLLSGNCFGRRAYGRPELIRTKLRIQIVMRKSSPKIKLLKQFTQIYVLYISDG